ncbi:MAG: molybdopterin molybdotransferase MoeA [Candidatus Saccharimonadales bacterium]
MLTIEAALEHVAREVRPLDVELVAAADAVGRVLAEDIASDIDSPPHDKSIVDGYAVRSADLSTRPVALTVLEEVVAGAVATKAVTPGTATRVMTGAPAPDGADTIVMVEHTEILPGPPEQVLVDSPPLAPGRNILRRGAAMRQGDMALRAGRIVRHIEIGLLSEVGRTVARMVRQPRVAVFSTGNELVPPGDQPSVGQIRNSNGPMLLAAVRRAGGKAIDLGIGRD